MQVKSLHETRHHHDENEIVLQDLIADPAPSSDYDRELILDKVIPALRNEVKKLRYFQELQDRANGKTLKEIANTQNVSAVTIHKRLDHSEKQIFQLLKTICRQYNIPADSMKLHPLIIKTIMQAAKR